MHLFSLKFARSPGPNLPILELSRAETMANEASNSDERQPLLSPPRSTATATDNSIKEHSAFYFSLVKFIIAIIGNCSATKRTSRLGGYILRCLDERVLLNIYRCLPRQRGYLPRGSNLFIHCFGV